MASASNNDQDFNEPSTSGLEHSMELPPQENQLFMVPAGGDSELSDFLVEDGMRPLFSSSSPITDRNLEDVDPLFCSEPEETTENIKKSLMLDGGEPTRGRFLGQETGPLDFGNGLMHLNFNSSPDPREALYRQTPMWSGSNSSAENPALAGALVSSGPIPSRRKKRATPEDEKDDRYRQKRDKNNAAAKKSRDKKKANKAKKDQQLCELEVENAVLKENIRRLGDERDELWPQAMDRK